MPNNLSISLKFAAVVALGLGVGAVTVVTLKESDPPASGTIDFASTGTPRFLGKSAAALQIDLRAPAGIPESETEDVTLMAWIRLNESPSNGLSLTWEIPEGVSVVDGTVENSWPEAQAGETVETQVTLRGFSQEQLKMVALHGRFRAGEAEYGNTALLTSRPEDSLEIVSGNSRVAADEATQKMSASSTDESKNSRPLLKGRILR